MEYSNYLRYWSKDLKKLLVKTLLETPFPFTLMNHQQLGHELLTSDHLSTGQG